MSWIADTTRLLSGGPLNECQAGHTDHPTKTIRVDIDGYCDAVPDYPPIPHHLATRFDMTIWDWEPYEGTDGYCPANDGVSMSIDVQGRWEGYETLLALTVCRPGDTVVDVGAHLGWFSLCAASRGADVLAIEADPAVAAILSDNADQDGLPGTIHVARGWINNDTPSPATHPIRLLKVDIEGLEGDAVTVFWEGFSSQAIDYAMIEVTPAFGEAQATVIMRLLAGFGYSAYRIPKGYQSNVPAHDPLDYLAAERRIDAPADILQWPQSNVWFAREGITR